MSLNKLIIIFVIILLIFAGVVFFQFTAKSNNKNSTSASTVTINGHTFNVELAKTQNDQQMGLSGRNSLAQDNGMLFLFDHPDYYNFWMKNMKFSLDIIFINGNKIVSIAKNAQPPVPSDSNPPIIQPGGQVDKVLEINGNLSNKYSFKKGDSVDVKLK